MVEVFDRVLSTARQFGASDVILKAGLPPIFRIKGELRTVQNVARLGREDVIQFANGIMTPRNAQQLETDLDVDIAYATPDGVRYRCSIFYQRGGLEIVLRVIPAEVPEFASLGLPVPLLGLAEETRGMVLVTGVTGSGKSTTLASMVEHINRKRAAHILTIEDPIEYVFRDRKSVVTQREVGLDAVSFSRALRAALRQNPDVVLVGEMRDLETIEIALTAAETGHLVMSTLHTADAAETINRVIGAYPAHQQGQARLQLASVLRGVVSQRLLPRADGAGLVPAVEILVGTARVREQIEDPQKTSEIRDSMATGRTPYGMQTFDQSLTELVMSKTVTYNDALQYSSNPDDFALTFRGISKASGTDWTESSTEAEGAGGEGDKGTPTNEFEIIR